MTALFAGVALTTLALDPVQSFCTPASSDEEFKKSVGPEFGFPIGNFSNACNWTLGDSVRADIPFLPMFYVTVDGGYDDALVKTNPDLNTLGVRLAYSFGL